jgi:hypothetical protein
LPAAGEALRRARFLAPQLAEDFPASSANPPEPIALTEALQRLLEACRAEEPADAIRFSPVTAGNKALLPVRVENSAFDAMDVEEEPTLRPYWGATPLPTPVNPIALLPDGALLVRQSLDLWMRRLLRWAAPLSLLNLAAAFVGGGASPPAQALPWLLATAVGAPITLKAMAREWVDDPSYVLRLPQLGIGQIWAALLLLAVGFLGLLPARTATWFDGLDLLATGLVIWLPLLGLTAPALMVLVSNESSRVHGGSLLGLALRRGLLHAGLVSVVGAVGGLILVGAGWGFLALLNIADDTARRVMFGIGAGVPQSLVLALVAGCGMDALSTAGAETVSHRFARDS